MSWCIPHAAVPHLKKLEQDAARLSQRLKPELLQAANAMVASMDPSDVANRVLAFKQSTSLTRWLNYFQAKSRPKLIANEVAHQLLERTEVFAKVEREFNALSQTEEITTLFQKYVHLDQAWQSDKRGYIMALLGEADALLAAEILGHPLLIEEKLLTLASNEAGSAGAVVVPCNEAREK